MPNRDRGLRYWLTGSIALYSDALETTINVMAAGAAFVALGVSARPADSNHPYGHHKTEYFSAVFEGGLVVVAAVSIFHSAYLGFLSPKPLDALFVGIAINAGASLINGVWAWLLLFWGRRWRSPRSSQTGGTC
jgi:cation diffusion facilitator family transporter